MKKISHRFLTYPIDPFVELLIVGTFNPETEKNPAEIFYGRRQNHLWRLLPIALGLPDLKSKTIEEKRSFIQQYNIGFIDIVAEVSVDIGSEVNYNDDYLDSRVTQWRDVVTILDSLKQLKKVCFTRKTFSGIPKLQEKAKEIAIHCYQNNIPFQYLSTPSRIYSQQKQQEWTSFFGDNGNG